jgi:choline dehydrogenase-like flavoprotein
MGPVASRIMQSARELGYDWRKLDKPIFQDRCQPGRHPYRARWTGRYYLKEAVAHGAQVLAEANVQRVLLEGKRVRGVEFVRGGTRQEALAPRVIVSAGGIGSPQAFGEFQMQAGVHLEDEGYMMTDLAFTRETFPLFAASALRFDRLFSWSKTLSIMIKIRDEIAGHVEARKMRRIFGPPEREKLASGYRRAREILQNAGAKRIWKSRVVAAHPGGTVRIGEHVDANLQTEYEGLYVCDCSVIADPWGLPPTLTLLSLAKRLAKHLA